MKTHEHLCVIVRGLKGGAGAYLWEGVAAVGDYCCREMRSWEVTTFQLGPLTDVEKKCLQVHLTSTLAFAQVGLLYLLNVLHILVPPKLRFLPTRTGWSRTN